MSKRLSVILGEQDVQLLAAYFTSSTAERAMLQNWASAHGVAPPTSDAATIRVLLTLAATTLADDILDHAYATLAKSFDGLADDDRRAARDRHLTHADAALI